MTLGKFTLQMYETFKQTKKKRKCQKESLYSQITQIQQETMVLHIGFVSLIFQYTEEAHLGRPWFLIPPIRLLEMKSQETKEKQHD